LNNRNFPAMFRCATSCIRRSRWTFQESSVIFRLPSIGKHVWEVLRICTIFVYYDPVSFLLFWICLFRSFLDRCFQFVSPTICTLLTIYKCYRRLKVCHPRCVRSITQSL
jgi:hypothetical protein